MFSYFMIFLFLVVLPLTVILSVMRMVYIWSRKVTLGEALARWIGVFVITSLVGVVLIMPVAILFAIACPGATRMSPVVLLGAWLSARLMLVFPVLVGTGGLVAVGLAQREAPPKGSRFSWRGKLLALGACVVLFAAAVLNGDRIVYAAIVPEARQLPLYPRMSQVAIGRLSSSYKLLPEERVLHFHTPDSIDQVLSYYKRELPRRGWVDTTHAPIALQHKLDDDTIAATWVHSTNHPGDPLVLVLTIPEETDDDSHHETMITLQMTR
ncbi:MAG TPA: hypothetical protein VF952_14565 [Chloroflexia bacterium]|jgi:hypothetical protein